MKKALKKIAKIGISVVLTVVFVAGILGVTHLVQHSTDPYEDTLLEAMLSVDFDRLPYAQEYSIDTDGDGILDTTVKTNSGAPRNWADDSDPSTWEPLNEIARKYPPAVELGLVGARDSNHQSELELFLKDALYPNDGSRGLTVTRVYSGEQLPTAE